MSGLKFFVIGGAGYVGSHFVLHAMDEGHSCVVLDNLLTGHREVVPSGVTFIESSLHDSTALRAALKEHAPDCVVHFAARSLVPESVAKPELYWHNNTHGVQILLDTMREICPDATLIFSSTCAVFGVPSLLPIGEDDPKLPMSPYGRTKLACEWEIEDYCHAYGMKAVALRYFNACGADVKARSGECHEPETHLIPNIFRAIDAGTPMQIFGSDFPTPDGTCVRDYIHVTDLADGHIKAAQMLQSAPKKHFSVYHLGTGQGRSNLEIVGSVERVTGKKISVNMSDRRAGDPPSLYANAKRARDVLKFSARHSDLDNIIRTAWVWHTKKRH